MSPYLSAILILTARSPGFIFAWRPGNFRASAYFAIRVFGKMSEQFVRSSCSVSSRVFAGGCAERRIAGGGMATSAGDTCVELEDPLVNPSGCEAIRAFLFPLKPHGRQQLVSASGHSELRSCDRLLGRLGQPKKSGCRFCIRFFSHS